MTIPAADQALLDGQVTATQAMLTHWQDVVAGLDADDASRLYAEAQVLKFTGELAEMNAAIAAL